MSRQNKARVADDIRHAFRYSLSLQAQTAHARQVLVYFDQPLFAFRLDEARPVDEVLVDLLKRLLKVL